MKFYKIRHKPTGFFFRPSRYLDKKNISKTGKAYQKKPSLSYLGENYWHSPVEKWNDYWKRMDSISELRPVIKDEWEIVEYTVNESL